MSNSINTVESCEDDGSEFSALALIISAVLVLIIWLLVGLAVFLLGSTIEKSGQIGDSFGVVNSLFSGLAFAGVICAILMQRQELQLQRKELRLTRKVLGQQAEAQEQSGDALTKQVQVMLLSAKVQALGAVLETARSEKMSWKPYDSRYSELEKQISKYHSMMDEHTAELNSILGV